MRELLEMRIEKEKYERAWSGCAGIRKKHKGMMEERNRETRMKKKVWENTEQAQLGIQLCWLTMYTTPRRLPTSSADL